MIMWEGGIFSETPSLMLGTIYVLAENGGEMPEDVKSSIIKDAHEIKKVPKTTIRNELEKIIMSSNVDVGIKLLFECDLLKYIMPQLDKCFYEPQRNKYHIYNVGEHIAKAVANSPKIVPVRWAALFHDIGKPLCSSVDSSGMIHFYGHHTESVKIANDICHKFSFDSQLIREILTLVEYHDVHFEQSEKGVKRALSRLGEQTFTRLLYLQEADAKAKAEAILEEWEKKKED